MSDGARVLLLGAAAWLAYLHLRGYRVVYKDGVLTAFTPRMAAALPTIDRVTRATIGREAILTSGTDGKHGPRSKHYTGDASDWRTRDLTPERKWDLATALDNELNRNGHVYDVLVEASHIHIEVDPKTWRMGVVAI